MMPSSRIAALTLFGLAACLWGTHISALEGADGSAADKAPMKYCQTPRAALKVGLDDVRAGNSTSGVEALKCAAAGGESYALWKLAQMYSSGDNVPRDDFKAYGYLSQIVSNYDEDSPNRLDRAVAADAWVAMGKYSLTGIRDTNVRPDPLRAMQMFQYAATNFGDANAQYNLARMHLEGAGVGKDSREALRWLDLAAKKGHVQAEALLGQILFTGVDGIPPQRALALMWLTLAREAAMDSKQDQWIIDLYNKATAAASDEDRQVALNYLESHLKRQN